MSTTTAYLHATSSESPPEPFRVSMPVVDMLLRHIASRPNGLRGGMPLDRFLRKDIERNLDWLIEEGHVEARTELHGSRVLFLSTSGLQMLAARREDVVRQRKRSTTRKGRTFEYAAEGGGELLAGLLEFVVAIMSAG